MTVTQLDNDFCRKSFYSYELGYFVAERDKLVATLPSLPRTANPPDRNGNELGHCRRDASRLVLFPLHNLPAARQWLGRMIGGRVSSAGTR